jgi:hypothetical protein
MVLMFRVPPMACKRIPGPKPEAQDKVGVEIEIQLGGCEREALAVDRPTCEQVHVESLELACTGTTQRKPIGPAMLRDERMHLVQEC